MTCPSPRAADGPVPSRRARLERAGGRQFGNDLFKVRLREPEQRPPALFGAQYDFFLEGVVDCPEFLVFLPLLEK